jgi:hypothetical protein
VVTVVPRVCLSAAALAVAVVATACGAGSPTRRPADAGLRALHPDVRSACAELAAEPGLQIRCPTWLPGFGRQRARNSFESHPSNDVGGCGYLVELVVRRAPQRPDIPFHIIFGGECRAFSLKVHGGHWPPEPRFGDALGLVTHKPLSPRQRRERLEVPRVLAQVPFMGARALVLMVAPYPSGGINGGHVALVWNESGSGYLMSFHYARDTAGTAPTHHEVQELMRAARSMTPR